MPLLETTTRTLPLQQEIRKALEKGARFKTDRYSITESRQQILTSYENALRSVEKAKQVADKQGIQDKAKLTIAFIKALAENWYGREETLRWSDTSLEICLDGATFFSELESNLNKKKGGYLQILSEDVSTLVIKASEIKSYWVSPEFESGLVVEVEVVENGKSLHDFFGMFQPIANSLYREKVTINDVIDLYHLFSLYHDGKIRETWSCNQNFVKRHEKYLKGLNDEIFSILFKDARVRRIK
jgi:hypothetical protein